MAKRNNGFVNELFAFHKFLGSLDKLEEIFENNIDKEFTKNDGIVFEVDPILNDKSGIL